jgi:hypothetical protein
MSDSSSSEEISGGVGGRLVGEDVRIGSILSLGPGSIAKVVFGPDGP